MNDEHVRPIPMRLDDHVDRQRARSLVVIGTVPPQKSGIREGAGCGPRWVAQALDPVAHDLPELTTNDRVIQQIVERSKACDVAAAGHVGSTKGELSDVLHVLLRHHQMDGAALGVLTQISKHQTPPSQKKQ